MLRKLAGLTNVVASDLIPADVDAAFREMGIDAPISKWEHYAAFDSAQDCESTIQYLNDQDKKFPSAQRANPITDEESRAEQHVMSECIATDDPRLKEK